MAKSDLLKEAIADARAVKETALANAKIALQEAFAPRIESMLAAKLSEELDDEEVTDLDVDATEEIPSDEMGEPEVDAAAELQGNDVGDLSIDVNNDGEFDEFDIMSKEPFAGEESEETEVEETPEDLEAEYNEGYDHNDDDLELESIIRELEEDLEEPAAAETMEEEMHADVLAYDEDGDDIDDIIEAILREADAEPMESDDSEKVAELEQKLKYSDDRLQEAYNTVKQLKSIINEVNLLNAKLLYTNKLFRNYDLTESQKMKVLENFDRASNTREVKLVFSTIAESLKTPTKKHVVKESYASKPITSTTPTTPTILAEGFELADRWKKLAGLSK